MAPIVFALRVPPPTYKHSDEHRFTVSDLKIILPDFIALIMVYACINFITPTISWFLESLGIPESQLLVFTALVTTVNGLAFAIATPLLTRVVSERTLPLLSAAAAVAIVATAFAVDPYQFIALRIAIGAIQAGIPPSLMGGKSGRKGTAMGFLNSARFMGMAIGPLMATSLLGNGDPPRALYMLATMMSISFFASVFMYFTHTRKASTQT
jgi:MFS family permease